MDPFSCGILLFFFTARLVGCALPAACWRSLADTHAAARITKSAAPHSLAMCGLVTESDGCSGCWRCLVVQRRARKLSQLSRNCLPACKPPLVSPASQMTGLQTNVNRLLSLVGLHEKVRTLHSSVKLSVMNLFVIEVNISETPQLSCCTLFLVRS